MTLPDASWDDPLRLTQITCSLQAEWGVGRGDCPQEISTSPADDEVNRYGLKAKTMFTALKKKDHFRTSTPFCKVLNSQCWGLQAEVLQTRLLFFRRCFEDRVANKQEGAAARRAAEAEVGSGHFR